MKYPCKRVLFSGVLHFVIILACLVTTGLCLRDFLKHRPPRALETATLDGQIVTIPGADWTHTDRSMVIVMSTGCHFCSASAGLYKKLAAIAIAKHLNLAAAFPQSINESRDYLQTLHVPIKAVYQVSLEHLHIEGTPTVLVVDKRGRVIRTWLGKLGPQEEGEVILALMSAS